MSYTSDIFVPIPAWSGVNGNWKPGRIYYNGPKIGKKADVTTAVVHWADGLQASTVKTFQDPNRIASAHASVEDGNLRRFVSPLDTAFNCGNGVINCESIAVEFSAQPGRDATDATYESGCQYYVEAFHSLGRRITDITFRAHRDIKPTLCCGTVDVKHIWQRCLEIESTPSIITTAATVHVPITSIQQFAPFLTDLSPSNLYSDEVKRMQKYLELKGHYFTDQGNNDGYYGPITQRAVHDFQGDHGILSTTRYGWWYEGTRAIANADLTYPLTTNA